MIIMYRFHFIDGSQRHMYDFHVIEHSMWVSAFDSETNNMEYIPTARIHKIVDLGKSSSECKK